MGKIAAISLAVFASAATAQTQYESPVWAPDGGQIAFAMRPAGSDWNLVRASADGSHRLQLTRNGAWDPAWAPDGKTIAFVSTIDGKRQISVISANGGEPRQLTSGATEHFHPAWSHEGASLACAGSENGTSRIITMNADGSDAKPLTPNGERARWPAWSPDEKHIAYYVEAATSAIWIVDVATASRTKLFDSGLTRTWLDWSPNGEDLVFTRGVGRDLGIDLLEVSTGKLRRVLGGALGPGEARWSPDGSKVLFSTHSPPGIAMLKITDSTVIQVIN